LNIFDKVKDYWEVTQENEKLKSYVNEIVIDIEAVLTCIISSSKIRFSNAIRILQKRENVFLRSSKTPQKIFEPNSHFNDNLKFQNKFENEIDSKFLFEGENTIERRMSLEVRKEIKKYQGKEIESLNNEFEQKEIEKSLIFLNSMNVMKSEPSFNNLLQKNTDENPRLITEVLNNSQSLDKNKKNLNRTTNEEALKILKEKQNDLKNSSYIRKIKNKSKSDLVKIDLNTNASSFNLPSLNQNMKKNRQNKNNKHISDEIKVFVQNEIIPNYFYVDLTKNDLFKNYEILKIEPLNSHIFPKRAESRKIASEKIFNDLMNMNQNAKRVINSYYFEFQKFSLKNGLHLPCQKTIRLERPLVKAKSVMTPSLLPTRLSKSPVIFSTENQKEFENSIRGKRDFQSKDTKINVTQLIPPKNKNHATPQSSINMRESYPQENFKGPRVLRSLSRLDASFFRQDSPMKNIEYEENIKINQEKKTKSTSLKELSPVERYRQRIPMGPQFHEKMLIVESLSQNRQSLKKSIPFNQIDSQLLQKEYTGASSSISKAPSDGSQSNVTKIKFETSSHSQNTNSILAKINEEQYLNHQLLIKRFC